MEAHTDWSKVKTILQAALDLPEGERSAYVNEACGSNQELRSEVERLLSADQERVRFLEQPLGSLLEDDSDEASLEGQLIGPYRLVRELGRGGLGSVYLAERDDEEFKREVAIKVLKRGMDTDEIIRRFKSERQILANLDHPNITRLLEGGTTDEGRPFFVMEYIEGEPIDQYCDAEDLGLKDRLILFRKVCAAVQFAHQNLVVHRDLKPTNILVTESGEPKLLDFGIAKLLSPDPAAPATTLGLPLMTPEYASPEQVSGESITTASDVYSLGVLLYELLTGVRPYRFKNRTVAEAMRVLAQEDLRKPSAALADRKDINQVPASGGDWVTSEPNLRRLQRRLSGDLDTIVLMALRKNPHRRYSSAEQFSEDVERYLQKLPVRAQKDTYLYRSIKFVRRHRFGVTAVALTLLFVCGSALTIALQQQQTAQERDKYQQIAEFLTKLFEPADPYADVAAATAKDLLDEGVRRVETELTDRPLVRSAVIQTMADVYLNLGVFDVAQDLALKALTIRGSALGADHPDVAQSQYTLGVVLSDKGDFEEAERLLLSSLEIRKRSLGTNHPLVAKSLTGLALVKQNQADLEGARLFHSKALGVRREKYGEFHSDVAESLNFLGVIYKDQRLFEEAEEILSESLRICEAVYGENHPHTATRLHNLALVYKAQERFEEAERYHRKALQVLEGSLGGDHVAVASALSMFGLFLKTRGRLEEALPYQQRSLAIRDGLYGREHYATAYSLNNLGSLYISLNQLSEAERWLREAVRVRRDVLRKDHPSTAVSLANLGRSLALQERYEEAQDVYEAAIGILEREEHHRLPKVLNGYAKMLRGMGKDREAEDAETKAERLTRIQ